MFRTTQSPCSSTSSICRERSTNGSRPSQHHPDIDPLARRPRHLGQTLRNGRADSGQEILATLSPELGARFGKGFEQSNLARMVRFARQFPDYARVSSLAERLSWSHVVELLAIKSDDAQAFYADEAAAKRLSVANSEQRSPANPTSAVRSRTSRSLRDPPSLVTPSATR